MKRKFSKKSIQINLEKDSYNSSIEKNDESLEN
jgi:hypothetical protein